MSRVFTFEQPIRFSHCDPAGIVYFPEYFDMAQSALEDWFSHGIGHSHSEMIMRRRIGTPTVSIQCDFRKPFQIGETLHFDVWVTRIGNSSLNITYSGKKAGEEHLRIRQTVCFLDLETKRPVPIPADLRGAIETYLNPE